MKITIDELVCSKICVTYYSEHSFPKQLYWPQVEIIVRSAAHRYEHIISQKSLRGYLHRYAILGFIDREHEKW